MKKQNKRVWDFKNSYTNEDLTVYPITSILEKALSGTKFKVNEDTTEIANKEKRKNAILGACPICKEPLSYSVGNVAVCKNEKCKGASRTIMIGEEEKTIYSPIYKFLHINSETFASKIFE